MCLFITELFQDFILIEKSGLHDQILLIIVEFNLFRFFDEKIH